MTDRILKGVILNCLACNRPLNGPECTRTYRNSDELIGLCNNCIRRSKEQEYAYEHTLAHCSDGATSSLSPDHYSNYYYEYFD